MITVFGSDSRAVLTPNTDERCQGGLEYKGSEARKMAQWR
jgi:hypothetical protein